MVKILITNLKHRGYSIGITKKQKGERVMLDSISISGFADEIDPDFEKHGSLTHHFYNFP